MINLIAMLMIIAVFIYKTITIMFDHKAKLRVLADFYTHRVWPVSPLFKDYLRILKDKCAPGFEWALSNPPKPHAFTSLPLQGTVPAIGTIPIPDIGHMDIEDLLNLLALGVPLSFGLLAVLLYLVKNNSTPMVYYDYINKDLLSQNKNKFSYVKKLEISSVILALIIVPLCLQWKIHIILVLIGIALGAIVILVILFDKWYLTGSNDFSVLGWHIGQYLSWLEHAVACSEYNGSSAIFVIIGLSMMILNLFVIKKPMTIRERITHIWNNRELLFIIGLAVMLTVFTINILLSIFGLGMFIDTGSVTLFCYSLFTKVICMKLIFILIKCSIVKRLALEDVSLSIYTAIFIGILGSINYCLILPLINLSASWVLTQLGEIFKDISIWFNKPIEINNGQGLVEGIYSIIIKLPMISKSLGENFKQVNYAYNNDRYSPFRIFYTNVVKNISNLYSLTKISKFNPINIAVIIPNMVESSYTYNGTISNLESLLRNNFSYISDGISKVVSKCSIITCRINLTCDDQMISIDVQYKNGCFQEYTSKTSNLKFYNKNGFFNNSLDNRNLLLNLTNPIKPDKVLIVNMQNDISYNNDDLIHPNPIDHGQISSDFQVLSQNNINSYNYILENPYDYNPQQGESSTSTRELSTLNKGKRKLSEFEDLQSRDEEYELSKDSLSIYSCISAAMDILPTGIDHILLKFDPNKLSYPNVEYLKEILSTGRRFLLNYYTTMHDETEARALVDNFKFEHISTNPDLEDRNDSLVILHSAFLTEFDDIIKSNNIKFNEIKPFSLLYFNGLDYDDYFEQDSSSSIGDDTELEQVYLNELEPAEINDLISFLRTSQYEYYKRNKAEDNYSLACKLRDIGFRYEEGVLKQLGMESEVTNTLTKLFKVTPPLFLSKSLGSQGFASNFGTVAVSTVCSILQGLVGDPVTDNITYDQAHMLINEIKCRMVKLLRYRISNRDIDSSYTFRHIGYILSKGIVIDDKGDTLVGDMTFLLDKLIVTRPDLFRKRGNSIGFSETSVTQFFSKLMDLFPKHITKDEIIVLISELNSRYAKYMVDKKPDSKVCLKTFNLSIKGMIIEGIETNKLTGLLENFIREKPNLFTKNPLIKNVRILINDLEEILLNWN